jgi:hypothetical protein
MVTFKFECNGVEIKSFNANMIELGHAHFQTCKVIYIQIIALKIHLFLPHHMVNVVTLIAFD